MAKLCVAILNLKEYSFVIIYRSGQLNVVADALTTLPLNTYEKEINAIKDCVKHQQFHPLEILKFILQQSKDKLCSQ